MVLTAIPTAIHGHPWCVRSCSLPYGFLTGKDFRTMAYGSGRVAGNWGQEPRVLVLSAATAMILPWLMILCAHECLVSLSILPAIGGIPSQRTPFTVPRRTRVSAGRGSLRGLGAARPQWIRSAGQRECGF